MSIIIEANILTIKLPNSEATIKAQHKGIADRTVGMYYMSERHIDVIDFLNISESNFYVDLLRTIDNLEPLLNKLVKNNLEESFKMKLLPQFDSLKVIKKYISLGETLHKIESPSINDKNKYLKFDASDNVLNEFRDLCLGDLTVIKVKKLSSNCFIIYAEIANSFDKKIKDNTILKWS